jgi:hypothetical protein
MGSMGRFEMGVPKELEAKLIGIHPVPFTLRKVDDAEQ